MATGESELSTDTDRICNDSFSDLVHSADNPSVAVSTTHRFTNECYDNSSTSVARAEVHVLAAKQRRGFLAYILLITVLYSSVL